MKKLSIALLALLIGTQVYSNEIIGKRRIVKKVKTLLKNGELDKSRTCLDEFMQRDKKLKTTLGCARSIFRISLKYGDQTISLNMEIK